MNRVQGFKDIERRFKVQGSGLQVVNKGGVKN